MSALLDAALRYAARGLAVLPVAGKVPIVAHGVHDATLDPELIERHFAGRRVTGVGIACEPSGLVVVDLDGEDGKAEWTRVAAKHAGHDPTWVTDTPGGGVHLYFRGEARSTTRAVGIGVDTRGRGGYVVAPPSLHPNGGLYRWRQSPATIAQAPEWLLTLLRRPAPPPAGDRRSLPSGVQATSYGERALEGLAADLLAAAEGTRNATLHAAARRAGRLAAAGELDEHVAYDVIANAARKVGLHAREIAVTWRSGFLFGAQFPASRRPR